MIPSFDRERALVAQGYRLVAGIDEVGRGPLAGPVVAAAVILPPDLDASWLGRIRSSKHLTPQGREALAGPIRQNALAWAWSMASPWEIDTLNIRAATLLAMSRAVKLLPRPCQFLLIDGRDRIPNLSLPQEAIVAGDGSCLSIAAASIVAKVLRDRLMVALDRSYPGYGFAQHKGYGTAEHLEALRRLGPSSIHRRSFAPVAAFSPL